MTPSCPTRLGIFGASVARVVHGRVDWQPKGRVLIIHTPEGTTYTKLPDKVITRACQAIGLHREGGIA